MFTGEFCEMFKNNFFTEHLRTTASDFLPNGPIFSSTQGMYVAIAFVYIACVTFLY